MDLQRKSWLCCGQAQGVVWVVCAAAVKCRSREFWLKQAGARPPRPPGAMPHVEHWSTFEVLVSHSFSECVGGMQSCRCGVASTLPELPNTNTHPSPRARRRWAGSCGMAGLPLFKLGVLLVRTVAKPVAKTLKDQAAGECAGTMRAFGSWRRPRLSTGRTRAQGRFDCCRPSPALLGRDQWFPSREENWACSAGMACRALLGKSSPPTTCPDTHHCGWLCTKQTLLGLASPIVARRRPVGCCRESQSIRRSAAASSRLETC